MKTLSMALLLGTLFLGGCGESIRTIGECIGSASRICDSMSRIAGGR